MKYNDFIKKEILNKINTGQSKKSLSKEYGISRSTIKYWNDHKERKSNDFNLADINMNSYSYILGMYLGDGYIDKMRRTYRLRIFLDSRQDLVIEECIKNLKILFPNNKINFYKFKDNYVSIRVYSNNIPILFPHIGSGAKHNRNIEFEDFQKNNIIKKSLMIGLFHTDGSFYMAKDKYPRYMFTNKSKQIIDIFCECLKEYEIYPKIRIRKNGIYDVQIQNKKDVNTLYSILGEKYTKKFFML